MVGGGFCVVVSGVFALWWGWVFVSAYMEKLCCGGDRGGLVSAHRREFVL